MVTLFRLTGLLFLILFCGISAAQVKVVVIPLGSDSQPLQNVITVSPKNGDFKSVASALNSINDAAADNPYLVFVGPGEYSETTLVSVPSFVHLTGAGPRLTAITSTRTSNSPNADAATVEIKEAGMISNLSVHNTGTGIVGIALYSAQTSRATLVDKVSARAVGAGGTERYAAFWNDAAAEIRNSNLLAGGSVGFGTAVNAAFGSVNVSGGFPQALIDNSILTGGTNNTAVSCVDNTGTGYAMWLSSSAPTVRSSYLCGGHRGIAVLANGNVQISNSEIRASSTNQAFLFEISATGSISVANSIVSYIGNKFTGNGTGLRCANVVQFGTNTPLSDGTSEDTACD